MRASVTVVPKPWGRELIWARAPKYVGKILEIKKGGRLSLQYHKRKHESFYVLKGKLKLVLGKRTLTAGPGRAFTVPPGTVHRYMAPHGRVTLVEVSTTELDDVVRLADDYGRTGG